MVGRIPPNEIGLKVNERLYNGLEIRLHFRQLGQLGDILPVVEANTDGGEPHIVKDGIPKMK